MTFNQLRYFYETFRLGYVIRAAEFLHVAQPSVSAAIRELEEEFGFKLFYRRKKRLIPTQEGELFFHRVEPILDSMEALSLEMASLGTHSPNVQVGVSPMLSIILFAPMYRRFRAIHSDIDIEMNEHGSLEVKRQILNNLLDMGIVILEEIDDNKFHILPLLQTELLFCVDKNHPLASRSTISFPELKNQPLILMKTDSYSTGRQITRSFTAAGIEPDVRIYTNQLFIIQQRIHQNFEGAFLMREMLDVMPDIVGIPLTPPQLVNVGLVWKKGGYLSSSASKFLDFATNIDTET